MFAWIGRWGKRPRRHDRRPTPPRHGPHGAAEFLGAYGLVAAFCGGFAFRRYEFEHEHNRHVHDGAEVIEKFGELVVILLLGSMVTIGGLQVPGVAGWLLVPLLLVVIRPALVMALFARSRMSVRERAFVAWFGVRGVGTVYYVSLIAAAGVLPQAELAVVVWTVLATVVLSIVVHGTTSGPALRRLIARRRRRERGAAPPRFTRPAPAPESSRAR